ncbi:29820_t:CDS:2 [Gigaspora margarita]|uniref:29820_t:CDS:1 n=1 Tax=Gigaspora margarita TaxID=4874 RepID=A0ABN7VXN1_GIGMA|nr:29820_t:CDS:2 [Gigaspora margarita]
MALERLKISSNIIVFILELFENKNIQIITAEGLTKSFCAKSGIEQEEIPTDICKNKSHYEHIRILALVYADGTVWIASNKKQMKKIIEIANNFFKLNNIQINASKSKLIVLNNYPKKDIGTNNKEIFFKNSYIKAENDDDIIRYLEATLGSIVE